MRLEGATPEPSTQKTQLIKSSTFENVHNLQQHDIMGQCTPIQPTKSTFIRAVYSLSPAKC
jgi:hypothetical protein